MNKFFEKAEMIFALVLVIGFFLPWVSLGGLFSLSGLNIPDSLKAISNLNEDGTSIKVYLYYMLYLIPILSIIIIVLGFKDFKTKILSICTGILPFIFLIYTLIDFGNIFKSASIGIYVTLLAALCLILSALGIIKFPKKNES